ncbi:NUDIX domain-containing protein [Rhizosaccharibacter radicis]|uniref:GDP-mannose pyrophosphatase n=1 Tax=Rhizosaccharibacter radicis TaxID=2782605 RepID=A0ABT1VS97_9PROT|nr:NUDIX hydrolase [Acetobacteraceae bacterium KSS12]
MTATIVDDACLWDGHVALRRIEVAAAGHDTDQTLKREVVTPPDSVAVLLRRSDDGRVVLTRQLRVPVLWRKEPAMLLEACAGNLEGVAGLSLADQAEEAERSARREAEEETGWRIDRLRRLFTLYPSPGVSSEAIHLFLADCTERLGAGGGLAEEGEHIETVELTLHEAMAMVGDGRIQDMKTALLIQHAVLLDAGWTTPGTQIG